MKLQTPSDLARLERGNGAISFDTVLLILAHLGIHLAVAVARARTDADAARATE